MAIKIFKASNVRLAQKADLGFNEKYRGELSKIDPEDDATLIELAKKGYRDGYTHHIMESYLAMHAAGEGRQGAAHWSRARSILSRALRSIKQEDPDFQQAKPGPLEIRPTQQREDQEWSDDPY